MQDEARYQVIDETTHLVELRGEFALATPNALREELMSLIECGKRLVVDLSHLAWTDETEVGFLVAATKRARELGRERTVVLVVPDEPARRIFETTGLDSVFLICTSRQDALVALGRSPALLPEDQDAQEDDLREQHYVFAHRLLRDRVFADPEGFATIMRQPHARDWLVRLWERAGDEARDSDRRRLAADGLAVVIDDDRVVVTMPPPQAPAEAYAATLLRRGARWRYFVLERLVGHEDGRAVLCEWDADGTHRNYMLTAGTFYQPPQLDELLSVVDQALENLDVYEGLGEELAATARLLELRLEQLHEREGELKEANGLRRRAESRLQEAETKLDAAIDPTLPLYAVIAIRTHRWSKWRRRWVPAEVEFQQRSIKLYRRFEDAAGAVEGVPAKDRSPWEAALDPEYDRVWQGWRDGSTYYVVRRGITRS